MLQLCSKLSIDKFILVNGDYFSYILFFDENEKGFNTSRFSVVCAVVAYLFGDYSSAMTFIKICRQYEKHIVSLHMYQIYLFYSGLISLELAKATNVEERKDLIKVALESIRELESRALHAPMNYLNKCRLLRAGKYIVYFKMY